MALPTTRCSCQKARNWTACCGGQIADALPDGTTFGFSTDEYERTWMHVIGPGDSSGPGITRQVLNTALASLGRPTLDS